MTDSRNIAQVKAGFNSDEIEFGERLYVLAADSRFSDDFIGKWVRMHFARLRNASLKSSRPVDAPLDAEWPPATIHGPWEDADE